MDALPPDANEALATEASRLSAEEPWPGLASFGVHDAAFFHGRETETLELFRLIKRGTLTLLFGKSGLGKSSLLNAGLFPLLLGGGFAPLYVRFDHAETAASLADQIQSAVASLRPQPWEATLWECLHRRVDNDTGADGDDDTSAPTRPVPVVVLDQFEEIFTLGRDNVARRHRSAEFFNQLADLIQNNCPASAQERFDREREARREYDFDRQDFKVVISMREEFLAFLEEPRQPLRELRSQRLRLVEMSGAQALEAITRAGTRLLDAGVGENIVRFVAGADAQADVQAAALDDLEVAPALLSLVCSELNAHRQQNGAATISEQLLSGSREQILRGFYERCFTGLDAGVRVFVEDQLLTTSGYRDSMAVEDAVRLRDVSTEGLETLAERRLLRIDRRGGTPRIEITHDILIGPCRRSRDRRHLREQGWWSKLLFVGNYAEKMSVLTIGVGLALSYVLVRFDMIVPSGWWWHEFRPWFKAIEIAGPPLLLSSVLLIAVFTEPRRWKWLARFLAQAGLLTFNIRIIRDVLHAQNESLAWQVIVVGITCYVSVLPNAFALVYLLATMRVTFARHHGRMRASAQAKQVSV